MESSITEEIDGTLDSRLGTHESVIIQVKNMNYIVEDPVIKKRAMKAHIGDKIRISIVSEKEPIVWKWINFSEKERKPKNPGQPNQTEPAKESNPSSTQEGDIWKSPTTVMVSTTVRSTVIQISRECKGSQEARELYRDLSKLEEVLTGG